MLNDVLETIEGYFSKVIYKNDSFMVAIFKSTEGSITITGPSFNYEEGVNYKLYGSYVDHPRYGFQFKIVKMEKIFPKKKDEIIAFFQSKLFPNIGKKTANKIYELLGDEAIDILRKDITVIKTLKLTPKQASSITEGIKNLEDPENDTLFYLVSNGFNNLDAQKIFAKFKLACKEVAQDNPFKFYTDVYGISFQKVKAFAATLDFEDKEAKFKEAYIVYALTELNFQSGDLYINVDDLKNKLTKHYNFSDFDQILELCIKDNYVIIEDDNCYLSNDYDDEKYIAQFLSNFNDILNNNERDIDADIQVLEEELGITYNKLQKEAIKSFFENKFSLIVGGPGTGKTTIVKSMVSLFNDYYSYNNIIVIAPTGRAAKRINEICNVESKTIHSLLRWDKDSNTFIFNEENPLVYDAIIIDEFSMVDNNLFACFLKASKRVKKICLIGDDNQLPSIRPGNLLNDLIEANLFKVTKLKANYRQREDNDIVELANDIINNNVDFKRYKNNITFYENHDNVDIIALIKNDLNEGTTLDEIQVLAPMYRGLYGIDNLNIELQNTFNPPSLNKKEKNIGKYKIRENDKILQLKNRPSDDVYNGDIGTLMDIDEKEKSILVNFSGVNVFYSFDSLDELSLAYAMSVHKSQGSEYQIVYFVFSRANLHMLNKKLIYTAISRAKKKLVIIGEEETFKRGLFNAYHRRKTTLIKRLQENKENMLE